MPTLHREEPVIARLELNETTDLEGAYTTAESPDLSIVATTEAAQEPVSRFPKSRVCQPVVTILAEVSALYLQTNPDTKTNRIMAIDEYQPELVATEGEAGLEDYLSPRCGFCGNLETRHQHRCVSK